MTSGRRVKIDKRCVIKGDLSSPEFPTRIRRVKGLEFVPPVIISRKDLHFVVVSDQPNYKPTIGFYDVPEKGFITWIGRFELVGQSLSLPRGPVMHTAYVFKAIEDTPPVGVFPLRSKGNSGGLPPGIIY